MKAKLWDALLISVCAVVVAWIEWQISEPLWYVLRLSLSIICGVVAGAIMIAINIKVRKK